jgi:hypothetical protein
MLARFRKDPLVGNVLGLIALFVALGAGAYAAGLARDSVKSKHIVDGQVKTPDLAELAVTGPKLADDSIGADKVIEDSLTAADINEQTLGEVPTAGNADLFDGKDSDQFQEVGSDGWTPLPLNNFAAPIGCNWTSFGGGFATPSYFRDRDGVVHLRGLAKAIDGTSQACGTVPGFDENIVAVGGLPAGHVPELRALFTVTSNNKAARVDVLANGTIRTEPGYPTAADTKAWVSLDGISFRCGPSGANGCP